MNRSMGSSATGVNGSSPRLVAITGPRRSGKTSLLLEVLRRVQEQGVRPGGYYTEGSENRTFVDVRTGERCPFDCGGAGVTVGRFRISRAAFSWAARTVQRRDADLFLVDEVGRLELSGRGLNEELAALFSTSAVPIVAVVRGDLFDRFEPAFGVRPAAAVTVGPSLETGEAADSIVRFVAGG